MLQNKDKKDEEEKCDGTLRETTKFWPINLEP
jgi:hypothetical protein